MVLADITWRFLFVAAVFVFVGQCQCNCNEDELCFERSLCAVPDNSSLPPNCLCDTHCHIFDDCCIDAPADDDDIAAGYNLPSIHGALTCIDIQSITEGPIYVVDKCPDDSDELTKLRCETYSELLQDVLATVPVSGTKTGLVFKNIFCARCHGATLAEEVLFWQLGIDCGLPDYYDYYDKIPDYPHYPENNFATTESQFVDVEVNVTETLSTTDFNSCKTVSLQPEELAYPRVCLPIVDHCSEDWVDNKVAENCSSYNNYTHTDRASYKNRFCAICNDVPVEMLSCVRVIDPSDSPNIRIPSMRLLLDLNRGKLSQLEDAGGGILQQTGKALLSNCPGDTIMIDISHSVCRPVICETRSDIEDGQCPTSSIFPADGDQLNVSCTLRSLNLSEYKKHENGTLQIFDPMVILHPGEYVQRANGNDVDIAVCTSHFTQQRRPSITKASSKDTYLVEAYLTLIGYTLSLLGLLILFIVYMLLPERRNLPGKCLLNLVAALFMAQLMFLLINTTPSKSTMCLVYSAVTHFLYLVAFFWMNVLGFDIWYTFQFKSLSNDSHQSSKRLIWYLLYAWGMPVMIVSIAVLVDQAVISVPHDVKPGYGDLYCWFNNEWGLLCFFAAPVGLLLAANIIFFSLSIYSICRTSCATSVGSHQHSISKEQHILLNIKLTAIMGLTWTFGFLANLLPHSSVLWYVFVVCGSLQGVVICLGFVCNERTFHALKARMKIPKQTHTTRSAVSTQLSDSKLVIYVVSSGSA